MKRSSIAKNLIIVILIIFSIAISGCAHKDKEVVVTSNVKKTVKQAENQVKKNIDLGNKFLDSGKYDEAKKAYGKAIELDKKNKQTYLTIKDKYLSKGKFQEAYDVVQEAVTNNVDTEDMKKLLADLKQKINANEQAQNSKNNATENKKNTVAKLDKTESQSKNQAGSSNTLQQEDTVENMDVFGIVKNVYERNGKRYISVIEGEFFREPESDYQAERDGLKFDEHRHYYIRPISNQLDIEVSNNAKINMEKCIVGSSNSDTSNQPVSYDEFKTIENNHRDKGFFWIFSNKDGVVLRLEEQFTP